MSPGRIDTDVQVVGGGPAGSWTALLLARQGFDVTLWDRAEFPRDKACGEYVNPGAVRILDDAGALDGLATVPISGARIFTRSGQWFDGTYAPGDGYGLSVRRTDLDARLLDRARSAGVMVHEGASYHGHAWENGTVSVEGKGKEGPISARCRLLVGADGVHSRVARSMEVVRPIPRLGKVAFVSHARGMAGLGDRIEMHATPFGCIGIGPGPDGLANVTVVTRPRTARTIGDKLRAAIEAQPGLRGRFDRAVWESAVLRTGTFGHTVSSAVADGVLLVGDSAQFIDPFTGEGIYYALRGAEMAAEAATAALASGPATRIALAPYERNRARAFGAKYALCGIIERFIGASPLLSVAASRFRRHPDLADTLVRVTGGILPPRHVFSLAYGTRLVVG